MGFTLTPTFSGNCWLFSASMKFQPRPCARRKEVCEAQIYRLCHAENRQQVHLVERQVGPARQASLECDDSQGFAHQGTDRRLVGDGNQGAPVPVFEFQQRLIGKTAPDLADHKSGLLYGGLGAGRHWCIFTGPGTTGAVAKHKDIVVSDSLQGIVNLDASYPVMLKLPKRAECLRRGNAGGPDLQVRPNGPVVIQDDMGFPASSVTGSSATSWFSVSTPARRPSRN